MKLNQFLVLLVLGTHFAGVLALHGDRNVLNEALQGCAAGVGFYRDGKCSTGPTDYGTHTVCAKVSQDFLDFTVSKGNDLVTPGYRFKGLKAGDKWCLCALRWKQALDAGHAPEVVMKATNIATYNYVDKEDLLKHILQ